MLPRLMQLFRCSNAQQGAAGAPASPQQANVRSTASTTFTEQHKTEPGQVAGIPATGTATSSHVNSSDNTTSAGQAKSPAAINHRPRSVQALGEISNIVSLESSQNKRFQCSVKPSEFLRLASSLLPAHMKTLLANDHYGLRAEFNSLQDSPASLQVAERRSNAPKNRYCNVLPFDFNRVTVAEEESYINASLLRSADGEEPSWAYVASQGRMDLGLIA
eukprot:gene31700-6904_t